MAKEVVIIGCSAGGLGIFLGIDQMADIVRTAAAQSGNTDVTVRAIADSGFFMEYSSSIAVNLTHYTYGRDEALTASIIATAAAAGAGTGPGTATHYLDYPSAMREVFNFTNMASGAHPQCIKEHQDKEPAGKFENYPSESSCVFAATLIPHIKTPIFFIQPQYDQWQILHIYGHDYTPDSVNVYGRNLVIALKAAVFAAGNPGHGAFVDSCTHHCTSCSDATENSWSGNNIRSTIPSSGSGGGKKYNVAEAFSAWYKRSLASSSSGSVSGSKGLRSTASGSSGKKTSTSTTTKTTTTNTASTALQAGVNWFAQERSYPCADCCRCSVDMLAQLKRAHSTHSFSH